MSDNIILAKPNPLEIATGLEGLLEIGGNFVFPGVPQGWDASNFIIPSGYDVGVDSLSKTIDGGTGILGTYLIPVNQPFMTQFSMNNVSVDVGNPFSVVVGIMSDIGKLFAINPYRYPPETQARYHISHNSIDVNPPYGVNANSDVFQITSDGSFIHYLRSVNGSFVHLYSGEIPSDVNYFKFYYVISFHDTRIYTLRTRIDEAIVPVTTVNSRLRQRQPFPPFFPLNIRAVDLTHFGVTSSIIGNFITQLSNDYLTDILLIPVYASSLYIHPKNGHCGDSIIVGTTVQFVSNGGQGGIFEASGGTILPSLKWQAPFSTGLITFTYKINDITATCSVDVVPKLEVTGVNSDGYYSDLAQGEHAQFTASCPNATFSCPIFPGIITSAGLLIAPTDAMNSVFGAKTCEITVTGCSQVYQFKVKIQPMFPTPQFGGAIPLHWRDPLIPDYLPISVQMTGGTTQVKNKNKRGIYIWAVDYSPMPLKGITDPCAIAVVDTGGDDDAVTPASEILDLSTAKRLDDFYKYVTTATYFSLIDYQSGILYKYVRLTKYEGSHNLYALEQTRTLAMRQEGDILFD